MNLESLVALSGGVDSSLVLSMASERPGAVRAAYVDTSGAGPPAEAEEVAARLGVGLTVVDAEAEFRREVRDWSRKMLACGLTPNPCARCNARVKLLTLFRMLRPGESLLTGHYARMTEGRLQRGADRRKDQSYFLSMVSGEVLARCSFPLGEMRKERVREKAESLGLPFRREESMDLCFQMGTRGRPGRIVDLSGRTIGRHRGIEGFTVGQRKGLGALGERMYVVSIDPLEGTVTVGTRAHLTSTGCVLVEMNWLVHPDRFPFEALVQTRYRRKPVPAVLDEDGDKLHIEFRRAEEAVAPGQVCAVYQNSTVMGGGIVSSTEKHDWKQDEG